VGNRNTVVDGQVGIAYINNPSVINISPVPEFASDPSVTVHTKASRRKEARPGELLAAALDLFVEKGFAATRVEEVAQRAGVSKGTLFLYFASKQELFKAVVRENISGLFPQWSSVIDTFAGSTSDLLRAAITSWWANVGDTKASGICKLVMSEASNFPELATFYHHEVVEPGNALIQRILQRGVARGEFRPVDLQYGVQAVLAPMMFLLVWKHSFGACNCDAKPLEPYAYLQAQADILLNGLCTLAASTSASTGTTQR